VMISHDIRSSNHSGQVVIVQIIQYLFAPYTPDSFT